MYGKIKNIEEINDFRLASGKYGSMDGYKVQTEKHNFYVLIGNEWQCCEEWGYFSSEDNLEDFLGAELLEINLTDTALNKKKVEEICTFEYPVSIEECQYLFVDFVTDKGVFQLAVYNAHNGYYGHWVLVVKDDEVLLEDDL